MTINGAKMIIVVLIISMSVFFALLFKDGSCKNIDIDFRITEELEIQDLVPVTVLFDKDEKESTILNTLSNNDFQITHYPKGSNSFSGLMTKDGLQKLKGMDKVNRIYIPPKGNPTLSASVPIINANNIWIISIDGKNITGRNQTICVVDTGVDKNHPDLLGRIIAEHCFCNYLSVSPCCPNGLTEEINATDGNGHGTHVAGIVAANGDVKGVAPDANIVAVRVTGDNGATWEPDIADGIQWCKDNKDIYNISIITLSVSLTTLLDNSATCDVSYDSANEVNTAVQNGIFVSVASGNEGSLTSIRVPSCASNATSVAATYTQDAGFFEWEDASCNDSSRFINKIGCGSNRGSILDLLAPGATIHSTYKDGGHASYYGTSQAAPHVAGSTALLIQYENLKNKKTLPQQRLKRDLSKLEN